MPSGSSRMRSTICCGVWRVMTVPSFGQCGHADAGEEQAEVVVDLGDGADRGARVARGRLLVDRDGRRQALDEVDVGLVHLAEELAGVGRQRLDVAALALGVDRVERQRRLARPRQAGEDDQPVPRELERDVAQVVLTGTTDDELIATGTAYRGHQPRRTDVRLRPASGTRSAGSRPRARCGPSLTSLGVQPATSGGRLVARRSGSTARAKSSSARPVEHRGGDAGSSRAAGHAQPAACRPGRPRRAPAARSRPDDTTRTVDLRRPSSGRSTDLVGALRHPGHAEHGDARR